MSNYWRRRETAHLVKMLKDERKYQREIERIYRRMLDNAQKEIDAFYGRYADREGISITEAMKRVSQLDIEAYERKAARYVKDRDFSPQANAEMRLYNATMKINRLEMLKANIGLELIDGGFHLEQFMGEILKGRTIEELERQAGILGKTIKDNKKFADAIVNQSWQGATFSNRIWMHMAQMRGDLGKLLENGMIQGKNSRVLAKELSQYYIGNPTLKNGRSGAKYAAERLMRTELARVQTEAQKQSFEKNGFSQYTFITNGGCCAICEGLSGKHFKVEKMMPGENAPPMHPHCRCSTAAYEDSAEYEAWLVYLDKGGTTEQWNKAGKKEWQNSNAQGEADAIKKATTREEAYDMLLNDIGFHEIADSVASIDDKLLIANVNRLYELNQKYGAFTGKNKGVFTADNIGASTTAGVKGSFADANRQTLALCKNEYNNYDRFIKGAEQRINDGWSMPCAKKFYEVYTVTHEYGHALVNKILNNRLDVAKFEKRRNELFLEKNGITKADKLRKKMQTDGEKQIWNEICAIAKENNPNFSIAKNISRYGKTNFGEAIAEVFANGQCGEPNELGKAILIWLAKQGY